MRSLRCKYGDQFQNQQPDLDELREIVSVYAQRSFTGCKSSLDYMLIHLKNYPKSLKGQNKKLQHGKIATLVVESVFDSNLYCCNVFPAYLGQIATSAS